jgi:hypothetical protein
LAVLFVGPGTCWRPYSTRDLPHEQLLMGLGAGGVSFIFVGGPCALVEWCWGLLGQFLSFGHAVPGVGAGIVVES